MMRRFACDGSDALEVVFIKPGAAEFTDESLVVDTFIACGDIKWSYRVLFLVFLISYLLLRRRSFLLLRHSSLLRFGLLLF